MFRFKLLHQRSNSMTSSRRCCLNHPDIFCYICGSYASKEQRRPISAFVKRAYFHYFGVRVGDQDKQWAPHIVCRTCVEHLRQWINGKRQSLQFGVPMVWREPKNHHDDCYFCMVDIKGINRNNRKKWKYPDLESARQPIPHSDEVPIPVYDHLTELTESSDESTSTAVVDAVSCSSGSEFEGAVVTPQPFNQFELNDLIRDLNLSKETSEVLASRLNEKKLLQPGNNITFYRRREKDLLPYFSHESNLVFCNDVGGLLQQMGLTEYSPQEWRLFIDSSVRSLKCVLLHNGNEYASIPIAHSSSMKEEYNSIRQILEKVAYFEHQWQICVDLKMVNFLLGQQSGYTKYPCFLCMWDSRAKSEHWTRKEWPLRKEMIVGKKNIIHQPLVTSEKIILPPLHIKLGIMKQFVKALNRDGACFRYLCNAFPGMSMEKIKAGIFNGPQIRQLTKDLQFAGHMTERELAAWTALVLVIKNFLGNYKASNYAELVSNMLSSFKNLGCHMSIKVHYLHSHLNHFPENLGDLSEEQGERFHQDIRVMEERYQGRWDAPFLADYCWSLQRHCPETKHSRKSYKRQFLKVM